MLDTTTPFDSTMPQPAPPPAPEPDRSRPVRAGVNALPPGTLLGEFEIVRVIGSGGFGIVYLANDRLLLRQVAIKEYLPASLAGRDGGQTVVVHHANAARSFAAGLASFLNEAQLLARFDHPALVKVYRFWRANDTAYMAMPYYLGRTLKDERLAMRGAPSETWLRALAEPLLSALDLLHREGVFHRDISPDNVMIRPDGRPVLLDFGSARHAIGDRTRMLTVLLKPNFAPVEQYGDDTSLRQGPWTDLYALGATLRFALTGQVPTPSVIRAVRDELAPLASASLAPQAGAPGSVSQLFLAAIDWALTVAPEGRPQDVASLRQVMRGEAPAPATGAATDEAPLRPRWRPPVAAVVAGALVALSLAAGAAWVASRDRVVATPHVAGSTTAPSLTSAHTATPTTTRASTTPIVTRPPTALATATAPVEAAASEALHPSAAPSLAAVPATAGAHPPPRKKRSVAARTTETIPAATTGAPALPAPPPAPMHAAVAHAPATTPVGITGAAARAAANDLESCMKLGFFARQSCVARQCARPEVQANPRCAERRRGDDERLRRLQP